MIFFSPKFRPGVWSEMNDGVLKYYDCPPLKYIREKLIEIFKTNDTQNMKTNITPISLWLQDWYKKWQSENQAQSSSAMSFSLC